MYTLKSDLSTMNPKRFTPFPFLQSQRLHLRPVFSQDRETLFRLRSDKEVNQFIGRMAPRSINEVDAFLEVIHMGIAEDKSVYWAICTNNGEELVGTICLWNFTPDGRIAEVGYELFPSWQGKGIMDEALRTVIGYAFGTLGLTALEAFTHKDNEASKKLLIRNGFQLLADRKDEDIPVNEIYLRKNEAPEKGPVPDR